MKIYTVSLLGNQKINRHYEIEAILEDIVKEIVTSKGTAYRAKKYAISSRKEIMEVTRI